MADVPRLTPHHVFEQGGHLLRAHQTALEGRHALRLGHQLRLQGGEFAPYLGVGIALSGLQRRHLLGHRLQLLLLLANFAHSACTALLRGLDQLGKTDKHDAAEQGQGDQPALARAHGVVIGQQFSPGFDHFAASFAGASVERRTNSM